MSLRPNSLQEGCCQVICYFLQTESLRSAEAGRDYRKLGPFADLELANVR